MNSTVELILMIVSLIMTGIILFTVYGFRRERGVSFFIGLILCRMVYSTSIILERNSDLLMTKFILRNVQNTSQNFIVPFLILFVYHLVGRDKLLKPIWKILLFAGFALWSLLMWLDPDLHIIYLTIELYDGHLVTTKSIYSKVFSIICYTTVAACLYFLFQYVRNIRSDYRKPGMWVLILAALPFVLEMIKFMNPEWSSWLLPLSVYCGTTGMIMLVIILRIKFFNTVPIARNIVLDTLQESIVIVNASGKVIDHNNRASQWFSELGYTAISGKNSSELLAPWPEWYKLSKSMQRGSIEVDKWIDGERRIYSVNVYPLFTLGKAQGNISLIFDITEKQRHLEQMAQLNQLKDQLFTIVSHDIRSPLALQFQLVELLEADRQRFAADHWEIIEQMGDQIRSTLGMANNLLEWFRSQREDMRLRPQLLVLSEVVEECCHMLHIKSESKQITVTNGVALDTHVYADRETIGLIIRNLLTNAIKFTESGGLIEVYAQLLGDMVIVSVRDNGVGMEEEQARQLFDDKQLNSMTGTLGEKGAGLGLLVSRKFVQLSGGDLWVESKVGQGSVFHFTLKGGTER